MNWILKNYTFIITFWCCHIFIALFFNPGTWKKGHKFSFTGCRIWNKLQCEREYSILKDDIFCTYSEQLKQMEITSLVSVIICLSLLPNKPICPAINKSIYQLCQCGFFDEIHLILYRLIYTHYLLKQSHCCTIQLVSHYNDCLLWNFA